MFFRKNDENEKENMIKEEKRVEGKKELVLETSEELYNIMLKALKKQSKEEYYFGEKVLEVARDSKEINESIHLSKENLNEIVFGIENINKAGELTKESLKENRNILENNGKKVDELNEQVLNLENLYKNYIKVFEGLKNKAEKVEKIVESINGVAYKINLLSLNASIEAARAGETGRGFSVVAQEIKKLADNTKNLSGEIEVNMKSVVADINKVADETVEAFENIENVSKSTNNMKMEFEKLVEKDKNVMANMEEVRRYSEENSDYVSQINDYFNQNFGKISKMTEAMNEINNKRIEKDVFYSDFSSYLYQLEDIIKELK